MAINSRAKGKAGELELAKILREKYGRDTRRGVQYHGGPDSPDVVGLPGIHIEVKRVETLNIDKAMQQAIKDSVRDESGAIPAVFHRKNREQWKVTLLLDDFMKLYGGYENER